MDTTAPQGFDPAVDAAEMLERLSGVDPADAPPIADELARLLSGGLDDAASPRQLAAEFGNEERR